MNALRTALRSRLLQSESVAIRCRGLFTAAAQQEAVAAATAAQPEFTADNTSPVSSTSSAGQHTAGSDAAPATFASAGVQADPQILEIKVTGTSPVPGLAGKIAFSAREGATMYVLATGRPALNQAIKGIARARQHCQSPSDTAQPSFDLVVQPIQQQAGYAEQRSQGSDSFWDNGDANSRQPRLPELSLTLCLVKTEYVPREPSADSTTYKVSSKSDPIRVATALSARIREGQEMALQAMGQEAVATTLNAISIARSRLQDAGFDLYCLPEFQMKHDASGQEFTVMRFEIVTVPLAA
jgi:stage V sporulation protein S